MKKFVFPFAAVAIYFAVFSCSSPAQDESDSSATEAVQVMVEFVPDFERVLTDEDRVLIEEVVQKATPALTVSIVDMQPIHEDSGGGVYVVWIGALAWLNEGDSARKVTGHIVVTHDFDSWKANAFAGKSL